MKSQLRNRYKGLRSNLSLDEIDQMSLDIANQCLKLDIWDHSFFHIFLSIDELKEVQTEYLLHVLQGKDKNVIVSRSNFDNYSLKHFLLTDQTQLIKNQYGIPEPLGNGLIPISEQQIDVVFVPLLVADSNGNRIGYGKGFYDRFLAQCRLDTIKIGLSFFEPTEENIVANKTDVGLDILVTPTRNIIYLKST